MKITAFETIPIQGRSMILRMFTDQGIIGYGEPMNYEHWRVVSQAVDDMAEYLVGKDPLQIEDHWQTMYRSSYSRSMPVLVGALSGIEMAMWDVFGKVTGMPVWKLLGGSVRQRVRVYTGIGGNTPEQCAVNAELLKPVSARWKWEYQHNLSGLSIPQNQLTKWWQEWQQYATQ